jgi:hypothetical protein
LCKVVKSLNICKTLISMDNFSHKDIRYSVASGSKNQICLSFFEHKRNCLFGPGRDIIFIDVSIRLTKVLVKFS